MFLLHGSSVSPMFTSVQEMLYRAGNMNQVGIRLNDKRRSQSIKRDTLKEELAKLMTACESLKHHSYPANEKSAFVHFSVSVSEYVSVCLCVCASDCLCMFSCAGVWV